MSVIPYCYNGSYFFFNVTTLPREKNFKWFFIVYILFKYGYIVHVKYIPV